MTDHAISAKLQFYRRRGVQAIGAVILLLVVLTLDLAPAVSQPGPPTGLQAERSRDAYRMVRDTLAASKGPVAVRITNEDLANVAGLASQLERIGRFAASVDEGKLRLRASRRLFGPIWVNVTARVSPSAQGFPPVSLWIGRLPLGQTLSRYVIDLTAATLRKRGLRLPPLDRAIRSLKIEPDTVATVVDFPLGSGVMASIPQLRLGPVDSKAAASVMCQLVAADRRQPTVDLAEVVRRAFSLPAGGDPVEANRARLVAIAIYTAGPTAVHAAPEVQAQAARCGTPLRAPTLVGREDLAKHWSLSAALTVLVGDDVGQAMGEWKELADSRPKGSGFSFVDLSADRSGIAVGRRAMDKTMAAAFARQLASVREAGLLPVRALAFSEGLTEQQFVARYGSVDDGSFTAAIARIDRILAGTVGS